MRYTRKDAEAAFERLALALKKPINDVWTTENGVNRARVGAWVLDHNSVYGGFVIQEIYNESGAITHPLSDSRKSAREFCEAIRFALQVLAVASKA